MHFISHKGIRLHRHLISSCIPFSSVLSLWIPIMCYSSIQSAESAFFKNYFMAFFMIHHIPASPRTLRWFAGFIIMRCTYILRFNPLALQPPPPLYIYPAGALPVSRRDDIVKWLCPLMPSTR